VASADRDGEQPTNRRTSTGVTPDERRIPRPLCEPLDGAENGWCEGGRCRVRPPNPDADWVCAL